MKQKKLTLFAQKRSIFFAEAPQLNEAELAEMKKPKAEENKEVSIGDLVAAVNAEVKKYSSQLASLPDEYKDRLHDEIRSYLVSSPDGTEFNAYVDGVRSKLKEILQRWTPPKTDDHGSLSA